MSGPDYQDSRNLSESVSTASNRLLIEGLQPVELANVCFWPKAVIQIAAKK